MSPTDISQPPTVSPPLQGATVTVRHLTRNRLLAGILAILAFNVCSVASALIVPWILALLLSLMFAPAVRILCGWHVPRFMAALLVVLWAISFAGVLVASLVAPARAWMIVEVPIAIARIELELGKLRQPLLAAAQAGEQITKLTNIDSDTTTRFIDTGPSRLGLMLSATPALVTSVAVTLLLTFIFLLHGDALLRKFVELAPALHFKKDIVLATRSAQHELSSYMVTITAINIVVGLLTSLALWCLGIGEPLLWGGVAAALNFAPFIGPMLTVAILIVVGFTHFATPLAALSVPGIFLALHLIGGCQNFRVQGWVEIHTEGRTNRSA